MYIAIVHDYHSDERPGGADLTIKRMIETAPKGIELVWLTFRNDLQLNYYDKLIIANSRTISPATLEHLIEGKKFVKIHFDYGYVAPKITREAKLLVFMSPKQRDDMGGRDYHSHVMPSLVDPSLFYPADKPGEGHLWVGNYSRQKGIRALWEWAETNQVHIDCFGHGTPRVYLEQSKFCHVREPVLYSEMPSLYKRYRTLVHLPKGLEAGSRVFIEAILSGLEVVTNEFEGDRSFERPNCPDSWRGQLKCAPADFWRATIEALSSE